MAEARKFQIGLSFGCVMCLRFEKLSADRPVQSPEVKVRVGQTPLTPNRLQYIVCIDSEEVAFVSFDLCSEYDGALELYEVFVSNGHRRLGIGSEVLRHAEIVASTRGFRRILLRPEPLCSDITKPQLIAWYKAHGFTPLEDNPDLFQKEVGGRRERRGRAISRSVYVATVRPDL